MTPDFDPVNWIKMYNKGFFWVAYFRTFVIASMSTVITSVIAFPCAYGLAFKVSANFRRWSVFFLIIPFFTSDLVRVYSWQVILGAKGVVIGFIG